MSKATWEMNSIFSDASNSSYDQTIELYRKKTKDSCSPCETYEHLATLTAELVRLKGEYRTRPCFEGFCFYLFTPHKSRIQKRIDSLEAEQKAFSIKCSIFNHENKMKIEKARLDFDRDREKTLREQERYMRESFEKEMGLRYPNNKK